MCHADFFPNDDEKKSGKLGLVQLGTMFREVKLSDYAPAKQINSWPSMTHLLYWSQANIQAQRLTSIRYFLSPNG
jgi:hypothetical protein